jgi:hypothetical protein
MKTKQLSLTCTAASVAVLIAGCGGGTKPPAAGAQNSDPVQAAYKFSSCMRRHGVPQFPDPVVVNQPGEHGIGIHVTPAETSSPSFKSAQKACQGIMPAGPSGAQAASDGRAREQHMLAFARCVRSHGFNDFPDPTSGGQIRPETLASAGINIHQPAFEQAAITCVPSSGGALSVAQIRQALSSGQ